MSQRKPRARTVLRASAKLQEEEERKTEGQRRINLIWERTQAVITIMVCADVLFVSSVLILRGNEAVGAFLLLSNAFFMVLANYYSRTNHTAQGGVGGRFLSRHRGE